MKSLKEIEELLITELNKSISELGRVTSDRDYYNEMMGDTSFILVALLESHLRDRSEGWNGGKWMDDSLIEKVTLNKNRMIIEGIAIWGVADSTEQWTEPFYFEIETNEGAVDSAHYAFLFGDQDMNEVNYVYFRNNRGCWNRPDRNWRDVVYVKNDKKLTE